MGIRCSIPANARSGFATGGYERGPPLEHRGRHLAQHVDLADHAARDDVEVVVAVVLATIRDVVVAHDHDVVVGLFPEEAAGQLAQPERFEVLRDGRARVGGDVFPLHRDDRCAEAVDRVHPVPSLRPTERCPLGGTRAGDMRPSAYRNGRYESGPRSQCSDRPTSPRLIRPVDAGDPSEPFHPARGGLAEGGGQLAWRPRAMSSATFWPPFFPISSKCSCPYFSETASPPIFPIRP